MLYKKPAWGESVDWLFKQNPSAYRDSLRKGAAHQDKAQVPLTAVISQNTVFKKYFETITAIQLFL